MTAAKTSTPTQGEVPQYRLTEPAYINDVFYDQQQIDSGKAVIYHQGVPAHFMAPLNAAAREQVKTHQPKKIDPFAGLTVVGAAPVPAAEPQTQAGQTLS